MKYTLHTLLCTGIFFLLHPSGLLSQELPQGYFRNPLDSDIGLSATFAEFRTGHFHAGIDMRTGGATGKPVHAAADGYVAKVSISPWGGGKILYIKHPNGYTTVYMHLDGYAGTIGQAVRKEQYAQQRFAITKLFGKNEIPVKKGQVVAYSGNTGGSGGPHLHFEVRRGGLEDLHTHATTINPLLFGLPYTDNIKPVIRGLRVYPEGGESFDVGSDNTVNVSRPFYLGIYATDAAEGSTAKNGVDRVDVLLDGTLFFRYSTEETPLDSSRMVNALIDYPRFSSTRQAYLLTRALPGAKGPWVPIRLDDGIFRLRPGSTHHIGIKVYDIKGNVAERVLTVNVGDHATASPDKSFDKQASVARFDSPYGFQGKCFRVQMPSYTLYADDYFSYRCSEGMTPTVTIELCVNDIPPNNYYSLSIRGSLSGVPANKTIVVRVTRKPGSAKHSAYKTECVDGWFTARVRDWGEYTLAADTISPTVRPVNFKEGKSVKVNVLKVKIGDNLSGVDTYNCYLNGKWILAEYDGKSATLTIDATGKLRGGKNELRVEVSDVVGNLTRSTFTLSR